MTITHRATGTVGTGSTSVTAGTPSGMVDGDICMLIIITKPDTATINTPSGWTLAGSVAGGGGTTGNGVGPTRQSIFYREKTAAWSTVPAVTITSGNSSAGIAIAYQKSQTDYTWGVAQATGTYGVAATVTNASTNLGSNPGITAGDMLLGVFSNMDEAPTWSGQSVGVTGVSAYGTLTERSEAIETTTGNDMGGMAFDVPVTTGTASVAPTVNATLSVAGRGTVTLTRLRELPPAAINVTPTAIASGEVFGGTFTLPAINDWDAGSTDNGSSAAGGLSIPALPGLTATDLQLLIVGCATATTFSTPSGWTKIIDQAHTSQQMAVYTNVGDTGTVNVNCGTDARPIHGIRICIIDYDTDQPLDTDNTLVNNATGTTATNSGYTRDSNKHLLISGTHIDSSSSVRTFTEPETWTELYDAALGVEPQSMAVGYYGGAWTGATDNTWTSSASDDIIVWAISVRPAASGGIVITQGEPGGGTNVSPTAITTGEALSSPTVTTQVSTSPTAVGSSEALGTPVLTPRITATPSPIPTAEALGAPVLSGLVSLTPSGVASAVALGTPVVGTVIGTVPTAIASAQAMGNPSIALVLGVVPTSIATAVALGSPTLSTVVTSAPVGIATAVALGSPVLSTVIGVSPSGVGTSEAVGSPSLDFRTTLGPSGIATALALGNPVLSTRVDVGPASIASAQAMGNPVLGTLVTLVPGGVATGVGIGPPVVAAVVTSAPTGVPTSVALGSPVVGLGPVVVGPTAIASALVMGTPTVSVANAPQSVVPTAIGTLAAVGTPVLTTRITTSPSGIATAVALGNPTANVGITASPTSIASAVALGQPVLGLGAVTVGPNPIASGEAVGNPVLSMLVWLVLVGIGSAEAFGEPTLRDLGLQIPALDPEAEWTFVETSSGLWVPGGGSATLMGNGASATIGDTTGDAVMEEP